MSLAINPIEIVAVLLPDGWHDIDEGSFYIDSYEFVDRHANQRLMLHGGGENGICASGFLFENLGAG